MNLNLNTEVLVRLSQAGADVWNALGETMPPNARPDPKTSGNAVKLPLWEVANMFGSMMFNGATNLPFESMNTLLLNPTHLLDDEWVSDRPPAGPLDVWIASEDGKVYLGWYRPGLRPQWMHYQSDGTAQEMWAGEVLGWQYVLKPRHPLKRT